MSGFIALFEEIEEQDLEKDEVCCPEEEGDHQPADYVLGAYLGELKQHPLVTAERELVLGKRIKKGLETIIALVFNCRVRLQAVKQLRLDLAEWLKKKEKPAPIESEIVARVRERVLQLAQDYEQRQELASLCRRVSRIEKKIQQAVDELVTANLRLVVKVAKGYLNRGLPLEDLIQEGNMGLIKAAGKYDYATGFRFSTYAIWWIRQAITRAIYDKSRTVRLPTHLLESKNALYKAFDGLTTELGREPVALEIAQTMDMGTEAVDHLRMLGKAPVYLDAPQGEDELCLGDILTSEDEQSPLEMITYQELIGTVKKALGQLPPREEKVLRQRFGFDLEQRQTLQEVGDSFKISRERVRQLENQALNRLRGSAVFQD